MTMKYIIATLAVAAGISFWVPGTAHADYEDDAGYLQALHSVGFYPPSPTRAIASGEEVCSMLTRMPESEIIEGLEAPPDPWTFAQASDVVMAAHVYLCPSVTRYGETSGLTFGPTGPGVQPGPPPFRPQPGYSVAGYVEKGGHRR